MIEFTANARLFSAGRDIFWHKRAYLTDAHIDELIFLLVFALECGFFLPCSGVSLKLSLLPFPLFVAIFVLKRIAVTHSLCITRFLQGNTCKEYMQKQMTEFLYFCALKCSKNLHV